MSRRTPGLKAVGLEQQIEAFLDSLRFEKRASPHTIANYSRDLGHLRRFAATDQITTARDIDTAHVRSWLAQLHRQQLSARSLQRWLSALRSFFSYAIRHQWIKVSPVTGVTAPRTARSLPRTLDEIGQVYGVTRERIRQIESKTMSKLRHPSRSQVLRDYLD